MRAPCFLTPLRKIKGRTLQACSHFLPRLCHFYLTSSSSSWAHSSLCHFPAPLGNPVVSLGAGTILRCLGLRGAKLQEAARAAGKSSKSPHFTSVPIAQCKVWALIQMTPRLPEHRNCRSRSLPSTTSSMASIELV